jgi:uncharacterized protein GlcG (DUF336 family)
MARKTTRRGTAKKGDAGRAVDKKTISIAFAEELIRRAWAESAKLGRNTVIAVCDESGVLKAFRRADNSHVRSVGLAITKARSAAGFQSPTHGYYQTLKDDQQGLLGVAALDDFTFLGGGYPIIIDGEVVGGIGVSGAHSSQEDIDFIVAAFKKLGIETEIATFG